MESAGLAASVHVGGNRYRAILKLALPTVFAMLSQSVVNEIDVVFFSRLPCPESSNGQAALLPSLILVWLFGGSLSAISVGTQALVARRYAEGKREAAGAVLTNAAWFSIVGGAILSVLGMLALPVLVRSMIAVPEVQDVALSYSRWRLLGVISMGMTMGIKAFFDGIGKTHVHLVSALVMNAFNVLFCWMFIFGHLGAPRMGAPGAGLSAFMATWIGLFIMIGYAWLVREDYLPMRWSNLSRTATWSILKLSIPAALATVVMMLGFGLFARSVGQLDAARAADGATIAGRCGGVEAINSAANTDIVETLKLTFTACLAFGTATATLIGQSLGRKQPEEAARWGWASVRLGVLIFGVVGICEGFLFTKPLVSLLSNSIAVRDAAMFPMRAMGVATPIIAVGMILSEALFGAGNPRFVAVAQFLLVFGWLVPGAWVLGVKLGYGLSGIWIAAFVYAVLAAITMSVKFAGGSWKAIKL
jgi:putative MATE family efflux protein